MSPRPFDTSPLEQSTELLDGERHGEHRGSLCRRVLATLGPGLMVCFADTDGSCLLTAADSGSKYRYKLLLLQIILVPTLYFAQELTVRLALIRGKGVTALIRQESGPKIAWAVAVPLLLDCGLALVSEISVFGQTIQACWGVQLWITNTLFTLFLVALVVTGSYNVAEKVGLTMGVLQVFFFATMFMNHPSGREIWSDLRSFPLQDGGFVKLVTANIGAVIMPWMLAYQQSALCEKGLTSHGDGAEHLFLERMDTALGSFLTQGVMAAMLITVAASPKFTDMDIDSVDQLLVIFADVMGGELAAKVALTFAICGACMVAAIVVTLCGSWALEEAMGTSTEPAAAGDGAEGGTAGRGFVSRVVANLKQRRAFFTAYAATCVVAWLITVATPDLASDLTGVWTQFINGLLMPPVVFALWYLAAYTLPEEHRLGPCYKWFLFAVFFVCSAFCIVSIPFAVEDALSP